MGTEEKQTVKGPDAISEELYAAVANLGRDREQKIVTASASGEEGLLHYLAYKHDGVYSGVLKDQLGVGSGRMADILRRLEEKELIVRSEDTEDSRELIRLLKKLSKFQG